MGWIPLVDLGAQHAAGAEEVAEGWQEVLRSTASSSGEGAAPGRAHSASWGAAAAKRSASARSRAR